MKPPGGVFWDDKPPFWGGFEGFSHGFPRFAEISFSPIFLKAHDLRAPEMNRALLEVTVHLMFHKPAQVFAPDEIGQRNDNEDRRGDTAKNPKPIWGDFRRIIFLSVRLRER